jgi:hypothetical protein
MMPTMPQPKTHVTHTTETITPQTAQRYLDEHNRLNRPIREWRTKLLAADMTAGRYVENGEGGVTFDWNGDITAGQHTLAAVIRSDTTIRCRVTRGVDPLTRSTTNDSLHQQFADDLGVAGVTNASIAEALLRKIVVWERIAKENKGQGGLMTWKGNRLSRSYLAQEWPTYAAGITTTIHDTMAWRDPWGDVGNRGAMQMFWWILTEKHGYTTQDVEKFFNHVIYGTTNDDNKLHNDLFAPRQVWWLIRAWNAWADNENLTRLQEPKNGYTDPYPKLHRPR